MKTQLLGEVQFADVRQKMQLGDSIITQCTLVALRAWYKTEEQWKGVYTIHKDYVKPQRDFYWLLTWIDISSKQGNVITDVIQVLIET